MSMKDDLGDSLKKFEGKETDRLLDPHLPICVRIDGRSFHTWTKGCKRPFDDVLSNMMMETCKYLIDETNALIGYTQSDEISLIIIAKNPMSQVIFGGKTFKLTSVLASMATAKFNQMAAMEFPNNGLATFDCRVWNVPNRATAIDVLNWRQADAERNSISSLAQSTFPHSKLQGKSCRDMKVMLEAVGNSWETLHAWFKRGFFVKKIPVKRPIEEEVWERIPADKRPPKGTLVDRHDFEIYTHKLNTLDNPLEFVFGECHVGSL